MIPNWPTKKIGEVCELISPGVEKFDGIKKYIATADVDFDRTINFTEITYDNRPSRANMEAEENDILVAKMAETRKFLAANKEFQEDCIFSTGFAILRAKNEYLFPKYLFYFLTTKDFNAQKNKLAVGATQKAINNEALKKIKMPIPPLTIQRKIVERLDAIRKAQKLNNKQIALANELFQSLSYKELNSKIKDWKNVTFGEKEIVEIIDGDRGKNYPKKNEFKKFGYCVFLNTKNVTASGFVFNEIDFISKEHDEKLRKGRLERNDVVLTTRGTVGNSALYGESVEFNNMRINSGMVIIRPNIKKIIPEFLLSMIQNKLVQERFKQILSGSAQPQLPICNLVKIKFPLPRLDTQRQIVAKLRAVRDYKKKLLEQKQKLQELFESCLDKAMKGK